MRAQIITELDDIQDRSDASAVAKKVSLLDALHLVAMSWNRVSEKTIENCFRKGGFFKTKAETPASEESDLTSEIFDQAPDGMSKEEFENWLDNDNSAEVNTSFLFQLDTLLFFFLHLQFFTIFLYMFRTGWSIIRRIKLHVQHLAPFPHSLLSRAWPLVLTE